MSEFRTLFTLSVSHTYYDETCRDFEFVFPSETARTMQRSRILSRGVDGVLYMLYETDGTSQPALPIAGTQLRFGIRPVNPYLTNFTDVAGDFYSTVRRYVFEDTDLLTSYGPYPLVGKMFTHMLAEATRPATVTLYGPDGSTVIDSETVTSADQSTVGLDAASLPGGLYLVREVAGLVTTDTSYYIDSELRQQGAVGVIEVDIDGDMFLDSMEFTISFSAKEETLRYYVVTNYSDAEILTLSVADNGYTEDGRPQLTFTTIPSDDPAYDGLDVRYLRSGDEKVILFKSGPNVPRRAAGRKKIQLSKNLELLLPNLPSPGPDKADAHMIIHLSKP